MDKERWWEIRDSGALFCKGWNQLWLRLQKGQFLSEMEWPQFQAISKNQVGHGGSCLKFHQPGSTGRRITVRGWPHAKRQETIWHTQVLTSDPSSAKNKTKKFAIFQWWLRHGIKWVTEHNSGNLVSDWGQRHPKCGYRVDWAVWTMDKM
jgi:hypothetical protein